MSSINSSDRLALLFIWPWPGFSQGFFLRSVTDGVKTDRDNGTLKSAKKLFQKGNLENKRVTLPLSGADVHTRSVGIDSYTYWGL